MSSFRRRSSRYVSRPKRNAERHVRAGQSLVTPATQQTIYNFEASQACTVRSIKLDIGAGGLSNNANIPYALVHVREGYNANTLTYPALANDLYNPTMDVLISGVITDNAVEDHKWNSIGRKLKAGDRLCLIVANGNNTGGDNVLVVFEMNFTVLT